MLNLKKMVIIPMTFASLASLAAFAGTGPLDDGVDACGVPVCDIEATITALSELDENKRYNYTNKLVYTYADNTESVILNNLVNAAKEIRTLTSEAGDADWVIREASTLLNNSVFNLAKYSSIEAKNLIDLFSQLDNQTKRYEVIAYWQGKVSEIENVSDLSGLVEFSKAAADISIAAGDEAWVARAANSLGSEITIKLTDLDPAHEGVYSVTMNAGDNLAVAFDKVIILDSTSEKNLVIKFINSKFNKVAFEYSHGKLVGSDITAKVISNGSLSSSVELSVDRATGSISGSIQTTMNEKIEFSGSQNFSSRTIFGGDIPYELTENSVMGDMRGEILGLPGTLSVRSFSPGSYSAHFVADNGFIVLDFVGKFFPKNGVLSVTHKNKVKLVLALREVNGEAVWTGSSFSTTNGVVNNAVFTTK